MPEAPHHGWDHHHVCPPTLAHRIHEELVVHESEHGPSENAREARRRVVERHNRPGPGLTVRPHELEERCSEGVCRRVKDVLRGGSTIRANCDACPGHTQSWALTDLREIREPLRSRIEEAHLGGSARPDEPGSPPGDLPAYLCDGCKTRLIREGVMRRSDWIEAHGGPQELVQRFRANPREDRRP